MGQTPEGTLFFLFNVQVFLLPLALGFFRLMDSLVGLSGQGVSS